MRQAILSAMKAQGVTQTELAKRTGIHRPHLSRWLGKTHRGGASEETIDKVMDALSLTVADKPKRSRSKP